MWEGALKSAKPTQEIVPIEEVRDGIVVLKNKGLRSILMASSINFALKSAEDQDAIIVQFQNLLNTLDFSLQFFIQSRRLRIEPYLDLLRERLKEQANELLRIQTTEYIEFIKSLVENSDIVSKTFYVVVPIDPVIVDIKVGFIDKLFGKQKQQDGGGRGLPQEKFEEYRYQLIQRVDIVHQSLLRFGVRAVPLNTEEIIELFYNLYNPGESKEGTMPEIGVKTDIAPVKESINDAYGFI